MAFRSKHKPLSLAQLSTSRKTNPCNGIEFSSFGSRPNIPSPPIMPLGLQILPLRQLPLTQQIRTNLRFPIRLHPRLRACLLQRHLDLLIRQRNILKRWSLAPNRFMKDLYLQYQNIIGWNVLRFYFGLTLENQGWFLMAPSSMRCSGSGTNNFLMMSFAY